jgi:hypothetical protein
VKYQGQIEPERLVFIDETWTKTNMATLRGWAPRGTRLTTKVPHGHWKTTTFLAALRHDRIEAPWVLDGPIDGDCNGGQLDSGKELSGELVATCGDGAEMLELIEEALDKVAFAIEREVAGPPDLRSSSPAPMLRAAISTPSCSPSTGVLMTL